MPRAKNGSSTKNGVVLQKLDFWAKNQNLGPKKRHSLLVIHHVLATTGKSCSKKKSAFAQIIKRGKRKNARFSVIPSRTGSVVLLGHFFDGLDGFP